MTNARGGGMGTPGIDWALFIILAFIKYSSLFPYWEGLRHHPFKFYRRLKPKFFPNLSFNITLTLAAIGRAVPWISRAFPHHITSFKGTSCWGRKIAVSYDYLSTAFSWRKVEYSKDAVQDQQIVPLLKTKSSNNDSVRRRHYRIYMTYPPFILEMPLCGKLTRPTGHHFRRTNGTDVNYGPSLL